MLPLFPEIKPNYSFHLDVGDGHQIYVEECGSEDGLPVVVLHGGPGAGCSREHRRFFNPQKYRIILFDQRGCGRSTPHAEIQHNDLDHLLSDIEAIRSELKVDKWVVAGGSWGSTLALAYAQKWPERVLGMIFRGVFLGRQQDIDWLFRYGTCQVFPDFWQEFYQSVPVLNDESILDAYFRRLTGEDELARMAAAKAWCTYEARVATLEPNPGILEHLTKPHQAVALATISAHYFRNRCFLEDNQLLENAHKLKDIPGIIVHGRYDLVCPLENAWTLQNEWNNCEIHVIRDAGHAATEAGIIDGLIRASRSLHRELTNDCTDSTSS